MPAAPLVRVVHVREAAHRHVEVACGRGRGASWRVADGAAKAAGRARARHLRQSTSPSRRSPPYMLIRAGTGLGAASAGGSSPAIHDERATRSDARPAEGARSTPSRPRGSSSSCWRRRGRSWYEARRGRRHVTTSRNSTGCSDTWSLTCAAAAVSPRRPSLATHRALARLKLQARRGRSWYPPMFSSDDVPAVSRAPHDRKAAHGALVPCAVMVIVVNGTCRRRRAFDDERARASWRGGGVHATAVPELLNTRAVLVAGAQASPLVPTAPWSGRQSPRPHGRREGDRRGRRYRRSSGS